MCCPCCSVNQLYQTALQRGNPFHNKGRSYNVNPFLVNYPQCQICSCDVIRNFLCIPCVIGDIMHDELSMPWYMACFTIHPCMMRNLYRYEHRIAGSDDTTELCCPLIQCQIVPTQSIQTFFWVLYSCMILQIFQDARMRRWSREFANFIVASNQDNHTTVLPSAPPHTTIIDSRYIEII